MKRNRIYGLMDELRRRRFELVHVQTPFVAHYAGLELARRLAVPCIETYHTHFEEYLYHYLPFLPRSLTRSVTRRFNRRQFNTVDALVVPSTVMIKVLDDYGIHRLVEIIATGLDEEFFTYGDGTRFRARYGIPEKQPVLVHIGRIAHEKNIDFLLRQHALVVRTVPDALLVIAGEGPAESHLHQLSHAMKLEDNVLFVGYLDRKSVLPDCYRSGNAFVFASKTKTQGLVLLEAMAQGVPVVSISALGTCDILDPGRGAIVAEDDEAGFADKVIRVLQEVSLREKLGNEGREYARAWSAESFAVKMESLYDRVVSEYRLN